MALVYLAMHEGIGGFEKLVVFKRIMPWLSARSDFVSMFLDEARLAAAFNHPNIVEIFDIGHDDEGYFIVMEYLAGESVDYLQRILAKSGRRMDPAIVCRIGASVAAGLDCAHRFTHADGGEQPVIHRDVTPSNIIVCYNGVTKLVDFGIAKADFGTDETRGGGLKGKISYLAPEQVLEEKVDARTDVFQLGIVLWQLLTNRSLFGAKSDHERMLAVMQKKVPPPSQLNPACPPELDEIVLSALARDRSVRCPSAEELRRRLEGLRDVGFTAGNFEVGEWLKEEFAERYAWRQQLEKETLSTLRSLKANEGWVASSSMEGESKVVYTSAMVDYPDGYSVGSGSSSRLTPSGTAGSVRPPLELASQSDIQLDKRPRRRGWIGLGIGVAAAVLAAGVWLTTRGPAREHPRAARAAAPSTYKVLVEAVPSDANIELDGKWVGRGRFEAELDKSSPPHTVRVLALGYRPQSLTVAGPTSTTVRLKKARAAKPVVSSRTERKSEPKVTSVRTKPRDEPKSLRAETPRAKVKKPSPATRAEPRPRSKAKRDEDWLRVPDTDNLDPWTDER